MAKYGRKMRPVEDRFWEKVEVGHPAGCWWWTGKRSGNGYGKFTLGQRSLGERRDVYAHRFAWELLVGLISEGMQIDHLCRNRLCVNPDHMQVVTPLVNTRRGWPAQTRHCKRGHPLDDANTYRVPRTGSRRCRKCQAAAARKAYRLAAERRYEAAYIRELAAELTHQVGRLHL